MSLDTKIQQNLVNYFQLNSGQPSPFEDNYELGFLANLYFRPNAHLYVDETGTLLFGKTSDLNIDLLGKLASLTQPANLDRKTLQLIEKMVGRKYQILSDKTNLIFKGKTNSVIYLRQNH